MQENKSWWCMRSLYLRIQLIKWENETTLPVDCAQSYCYFPVIRKFQAFSHSLGHTDIPVVARRTNVASTAIDQVHPAGVQPIGVVYQQKRLPEV